MKKRVLLGGCGSARDKRIVFNLSPEPDFSTCDLVAWDIDPNLTPKADVLHDLNVLPYPFEDNEFDECHFYECLEHCGRQGDATFFFAQWAEFYRILKPDGFLVGTTPAWDSQTAWCMPDHCRVIAEGSLAILDHRYYLDLGQPSGKGKADYRGALGTTNFQTLAHKLEGENFGFVMRAIK